MFQGNEEVLQELSRSPGGFRGFQEISGSYREVPGVHRLTLIPCISKEPQVRFWGFQGRSMEFKACSSGFQGVLGAIQEIQGHSMWFQGCSRDFYGVS